MITSPLNLESQIREPSRHFDSVPFIDLCLIGLFIVLSSSKFIFAPGLNIDLPEAVSQELEGVPTTAVLTVRENDMIVFEGQIFSFVSLENRLINFSKENEKKINSILLVKIDKNVKVQQLLEILDMVRPYFSSVQIAAEEKKREYDIFPN